MIEYKFILFFGDIHFFLSKETNNWNLDFAMVPYSKKVKDILCIRGIVPVGSSLKSKFLKDFPLIKKSKKKIPNIQSQKHSPRSDAKAY